MFIRISIDKIDDNPYQTRIEYGDIAELVDSILKMRAARPETSGLIQVPPGRLLDDGEPTDPFVYEGEIAELIEAGLLAVELAAGHRRLRAFRQLHDADGDGEYGTFPVEVQVLDDQAMADIAWEENVKRKDLSPIEEAEALGRAMERFGWTQAEIGERWGLSQPAVANKLRLLRLPEEAQAAIQEGQLSERHGRALLKAAGKSQRIYQRAAEKVIPVAVEPEAASKAVELEKRYPFHSVHSGLGDVPADARCEACGGAVGFSMDNRVYSAVNRETSERLFLCRGCEQAASGWSTPSAAEADELVERVIRQEGRLLERATWPLDVVVGEGDPEVQAARCEDCEVRDVDGDRARCLDEACYKAKEDHWFGYQVQRLQGQLEAMFGARGQVYRDYGGYDLRASDEDDVSLIRAGVCAPGKCERLRFRYMNYESEYHIRPVEGLPFIYNCNNSTSHKACQRRYLKSLRSDDEVAAETAAERGARARRREGKAFLERARLSVAKAILEGHERAWRRLAQTVTGTAPKDGQSVGAMAADVAGFMLGEKTLMEMQDWNSEKAVEWFESSVRSSMERMGVGMLPGVEDLERQLERVRGFILDEEGRRRADLTAEQAEGNLENLDKVEAELGEMIQDGRTAEGNVERLRGWIEELRGVLDISREI